MSDCDLHQQDWLCFDARKKQNCGLNNVQSCESICDKSCFHLAFARDTSAKNDTRRSALPFAQVAANAMGAFAQYSWIQDRFFQLAC